MWTEMVATACRRMALSLIALLTLLPLSALRAETLDELYEKAKAEKSLVFYTGAGAAAAKATAEAFEEALSWHLGHWQRRLQQRAGLRDRPAAQRQEGHHRLLAVSDHPRLSPVGQGGSADAFQT